VYELAHSEIEMDFTNSAPWRTSGSRQAFGINHLQLEPNEQGPPERPVALGFCLTLRCQFSCGQTGGCRRVDARFALAAWTLAFGPPALRRRSRRTPVTLGIGLYRHSSRLARDGARNQFINRASKRIQKTFVPSHLVVVGIASYGDSAFNLPHAKGNWVPPSPYSRKRHHARHTTSRWLRCDRPDNANGSDCDCL